MKKNFKNVYSKKGFTLVELVVVLVILAILSAMLMPSLSGYIDKAKEKRVVAEVHQVVVAAQTMADEIYALQDAPDYEEIDLDEVKALAEIKGDIESIAIEIDSGKVVYAAVTRGDITAYFDEDEEAIVTEAPTAPTGNGYAILAPETPEGEEE